MAYHHIHLHIHQSLRLNSSAALPRPQQVQNCLDGDALVKERFCVGLEGGVAQVVQGDEVPVIVKAGRAG